MDRPPSDAVAEAGMRALVAALRREQPGFEFTFAQADEEVELEDAA